MLKAPHRRIRAPKRGASKFNTVVRGGVVVNLVKSYTITPFYQLPVSDAQEYQKAFLSIEVGCGTWGCNGSNPEAHSEPTSLDRSE